MKLPSLICLAAVLFVSCGASNDPEDLPCPISSENPTNREIPYRDGTTLRFIDEEGTIFSQVVARNFRSLENCTGDELVSLNNSDRGFSVELFFPATSRNRLIAGSFQYEEETESSDLEWYIDESGNVGPNSPFPSRIIADTTINGSNYKLLAVIPGRRAEEPTDVKNLYYHPDHGVVVLEWLGRPTISLIE